MNGMEVEGTMTPFEGENFTSLYESESYRPFFEVDEVSSSKRIVPVTLISGLLPHHPVELGSTWDIPGSVVEELLAQLHSPVLTDLNIDSPGSAALLSGISQEYYKVDMRLHAQFQFGDYIYVTPAQFKGELVLDRKEGTVESFLLEVPEDHYYNVAYEVHGDDWSTGLGKVETMKLSSVGEGVPKEIGWDEELSSQQARNILERQLYTFQEIDWLELPEALALSKEQKKPILAVVLEGALEDQSC